MKLIDRMKQWARTIKRDVVALWLAARHPRTPWYAKVAAAMVAAYALSPIDLVPDFIPVLGYLDDLIIVPVGILLVIKLIPDDLMTELRGKAAAQESRPQSYVAAVLIAAIWIVTTSYFLWALWPIDWATSWR